MPLERLKYPIGRYEQAAIVTPAIRSNWISEIALFPTLLSDAVRPLSDHQLDTIYRPKGWTIRQVVHHCADSHMNALIRLKLTLTEDQPTIRPYFEDRWAELNDTIQMPIEPSLNMIEGIHKRWTALLNHLEEDQFARTFIHPEHGKAFRIDEHIGIYAWHGRHHLAHITETVF